MLAVLGLAPLARAEPPPGLSPAEQALWRRAEAAADADDVDGAVAGWTVLWRGQERVEALLAAADALRAAGEPARAAALLAEGLDDPDVALAWASLLLDPDAPTAIRDPGAALERLERVARVWPGRPEAAALQARAHARLDHPAEARAFLEAWLGFGAHRTLDEDEAVRVTTAVHDALLRDDDLDGAAEVVALTLARLPGTRDALDGLRDRAEMDLRARQLAAVGPQPLTGDQRQRLDRAGALRRDGAPDEALALVDAVLDEAPRNPRARGLRASLRLEVGDVSGAEQDLVVAEALDPLDPRWPEALGDLLATWYAGRYDAQAVAAWDRALRMQPRPDPALLLRKAEAELRLRRVRTARDTLERLRDRGEEAPEALQAARLLRDLDRERPAGEVLPAGRNCPDDVGDDACTAFWRAYVHHRRDAPGQRLLGRDADREIALAAIGEARTLAPGWVRAINLEAAIRRARGEALDRPAERERSEALFRESLALDPAQPDIWVHLGALREAEGDHEAALQAWREAVALDAPGGAAAHVYLAEEAWRSWRPLDARQHLAAYRAERTPGAVQDALGGRAEALDQEIGAALTLGAVTATVVGVAAVGLPVALIVARRRGRTVDDLLAAAPDAWREVAALAATLRHEVLKHHTTVLDAVADALEQGDPEPAAWAADRLFGPHGAVARGRRVLDTLRSLGRRCGVPVDLDRDPTFGPLVEGLGRLAALRGPLARGSRRCAPELHAVSALLHDRAYPALGRLVRRVCVLRLDEALLREAWGAVLDEPALREVEAPELVLDLPDTPVHLRIWKHELLDVLVNLLRNAVQASRAAATDRVGLRVVVEEDPVTFLERVALRVADEAPRTLSTAMIRGRYIERGLGLTVDRISKNGGSIHVEDEPGWTKAVVVRLPCVEAPDLEAP